MSDQNPFNPSSRLPGEPFYPEPSAEDQARSALQAVIAALTPLSVPDRSRVIEAAKTFLNVQRTVHNR